MPIVTAAKPTPIPKMTRYEPTVRLLCRQVGLPEPLTEHKFAPGRKFAFDFCWPMRKLALEVDGGIWVQGRHSRGSGLLREHDKMNLAARHGWRVFRCTPQNVGDLALYRLIKEAE